MKAIRNIVDKIKPTFSKGGKLGFLHSTFDAFETFLFVPNTTTQHGAHVRDCNDMKRTMITVVVALIPCLLFGCLNTGMQVGLGGWMAFLYGLVRILPMIAVSYIVGLGIEFTVAQWRGHEVNEGFLVSGLLIPLVMPVSTPLWMVALGTAFAVVFGKEIFGGTGMNVFNPALLARAFTLRRCRVRPFGTRLGRCLAQPMLPQVLPLWSSWLRLVQCSGRLSRLSSVLSQDRSVRLRPWQSSSVLPSCLSRAWLRGRLWFRYLSAVWLWHTPSRFAVLVH